MQQQISILRSALYIRFVRWAFTRFYREFAWTYDTVAWLVSGGLWRNWALTALPYARGAILEIGCGTGFVQEALARQGPGAAVAIDASPQMLALTRRRLKRAGLDALLGRAWAQALPFAPASFDTVLATFPTEYILDPETAGEIRRVLRPDGQLVIVAAAQLTSARLYERAVDLAYRLALRTSVRETRVAERVRLPALEATGFSFTQRWEPVGPGSVLLLLGRLGRSGRTASCQLPTAD